MRDFMSKVSKACEFSPKVRKEIYDRDNYRCIMPNCYNTFGLGVAHIHLSRAKGGLGVKQNGVLLCQEHHGLLDNGRDISKANYIDKYCKNYLTGHYGTITLDMVRYDKWKGLRYDSKSKE